MHNIWLELTQDRQFAGLHHYHIVALALQKLENELKEPALRDKILAQLKAKLEGKDSSSN